MGAKKLMTGTETETDFCKALAHEFFRCEDAFKAYDRAESAYIMGRHNLGAERRLSFTAYNCYAAFLQSLYEFYKGAMARDQGFTELKKAASDKEKHDTIDRCLWAETERILVKRRAYYAQIGPGGLAFLTNHPPGLTREFATAFRTIRNLASGHVAYERVARASLASFYTKYHVLIIMLYRDAAEHWSAARQLDFPELGEITSFAKAVREFHRTARRPASKVALTREASGHSSSPRAGNALTSPTTEAPEVQKR